ncbi:hypothetical protein HX866_11500 [Pseudomonas gingeri]|uniref:phage tail protein n=1 Tax=Pseudomonas gingeri TaxID=117681 RepID=UPI0015A15C11|nr:phage tail protein [Pseudomonas gingeri]NWA25521.1 hypothetical protein [Pseudomonas gingeri]
MSQAYEPLLCGWTLPSIIAEICERAGVPFDRIDVGLLDGYIDGFSTTNAHSAASAIEALAGVIPFDPANYGGRLHFIPRGGKPVAMLTQADLVDDGEEAERTSRGDSITVPRVVNLEYYDTEGGLTTDKQTSDRSFDNRSKAESTTETVVIMRADDAARAVVIGHKISIEEQRGEVEFSLPDSWLELVVSDIVMLGEDRLRITDIEIDDGQQNYKATFDRASAYISNIEGVPAAVPPEPPSLVISDSVMEFIDSHILRSADDALGYYIAVSSFTNNWTGAVVELSKDGGANWIDSSGTQANAIMGKTLSSLPVHTRAYRDDRNVITVELLRTDMELIAATQTEMQNRVNLAIIGDELINFSSVEQVGEKTWELGGLLRGRKGSAITSHAAGERFVLLDRIDVTFIDAELFELGRPLMFRVTSYGLSDGPTTSITFIGRSQQERQPAYMHAHRVGSDLRVTWQGVGRTGGGASVGMGRYFTGYRITLAGTSYDTPNRSMTIPYSAGALSVRQINSITGEGPAVTVNV